MRKGYTLIEVLISLTIIGLLFSFGYANFRDYSRRQAVVSAGRAVMGDLRLAQSKASAGEKPCVGTLSTYNFIAGTSSYQIMAVCSGGNVGKTQNLPSGISMTSTQNIISFKVLGQGNNVPQGNNVVITLTQTGTNNTSSVTVTSGGEIK